MSGRGMRVLYVTNYQGPSVVAQRGHRRMRTLGPSRKVELITRGLLSRGHEVHVLSAGTVREGTGRWYRGFECREPGCGEAPVTYLPGLDVPRLNLLLASALLPRHLGRAPPCDVVLLYNLEWYFLKPVAAFAARRGLPLAVEYEDDVLSDIDVRFTAWHRARGRKALALARRRLRGVVAVAPELAVQLGVANAVVLPGAVGDDLLGLPRAAPGEGPVRLVYAGGLNEEKGPDLLVEALGLVQTPVELDVLGAGRLLEPLRAAAARAPVPVRVHGEVSREAMAAVLGRADLAVNPHRMGPERQGQVFPFKVLEYAAAGLPVVSSRLGELPAPLRPGLHLYGEDTPRALAAALEAAAAALPALRAAAAAARPWVAAEYSGAALAGKVEGVLARACAAGAGA